MSHSFLLSGQISDRQKSPDVTNGERKTAMNVMMVRAKVKPESASEAEAATRSMFSALNHAHHPAGVHYASCKLADGVTFLALVALEDQANNPLPAIPEWVAFQESLEAWRDGPPDVEQLTVVGSYGLFQTPTSTAGG
jgi:hypothetical protein